MRELYNARLEQKLLLCEAAQCYHFAFVFDEQAPPTLEPGQFLSLVAEDAFGKTYTRAYSIASAPLANGQPVRRFDLCVNRVEGGFFSNLLCDMREGETVRCHGPHGLFTLRPSGDGLLIAAGTGIAPMRGFAQWLFPSESAIHGTGGSIDRDVGGIEDRRPDRDYWLIYEAPQPGELFYHSYFEELAATHANFHYLPVLGSEASHDQLHREIARITPCDPAPAVAGTTGSRAGPQDRASQTAQDYDRYAYVCGLSEVVKTARAQLLALGWEKRQVLFERYD